MRDPGMQQHVELMAWSVVSADPQHHLVEGARRQAHLSRGLPPETRKRRLAAYLQRRRHSWDTVSTVLQRVDLA